MYPFVLITFLLDIVLILQREILPWSVMRIKGLAFCHKKKCVSNGIGTRLVNVKDNSHISCIYGPRKRNYNSNSGMLTSTALFEFSFSITN